MLQSTSELENQPPKKSETIVEWHDSDGWTQEMLLWMMAWIQVCEEHLSSRTHPYRKTDNNEG